MSVSNGKNNRVKKHLGNGTKDDGHSGAREKLLGEVYLFDGSRFHPVPWEYYTCLSIESAAVMAALINLAFITARKKKRCKEGLHVRHMDGKVWFWCSVNRLCKRFNITRKIEKRIMHNLQKAGLVQKRTIGIPRRRYVHINVQYLNDLVRKGLGLDDVAQ